MPLSGTARALFYILLVSLALALVSRIAHQLPHLTIHPATEVQP